MADDQPPVQPGGGSPADGSGADRRAARKEAHAGADLVRESLARAKAARRARGAPEPRRARPGRSGPPVDSDEPMAFGASMKDLLEQRGWSGQAAAAGVVANWSQLVGEDIASHCHAVRLKDGELLVEAESTAWATQLRLLQRQILASIGRQTGDRIVTRLTVRGPSGPSWTHGRFRVQGPGPRDTYG